jgi:hypothetical protein
MIIARQYNRQKTSVAIKNRVVQSELLVFRYNKITAAISPKLFIVTFSDNIRRELLTKFVNRSDQPDTYMENHK